MRVSDIDIGYENISELFDDGQTNFAVWFARMMDANGWSHPGLVKLATTCSNGKAWVHGSQAHSLRYGRLKSPGPRSFAVLAYLFAVIDAYQKGTMDEHMPDMSMHKKAISNAVILRDDDDNPASIGYMFEVFCGWRIPPANAIQRNFTDEQAALVSKAAGKMVRRLMAASQMDLIDDMPRLKKNFSNDKDAQEVLEKVVIGQAEWSNEELDHNVTCLCHMLQKVFKQDLNSEELMNDLLKSI
jgi:hypothetical protein|tara:strand:- start:550 stop:1278 length:729 start_codon:yes stop_codon:yes gene_type:complete